jgi:hypothetical protein
MTHSIKQTRQEAWVEEEEATVMDSISQGVCRAVRTLLHIL